MTHYKIITKEQGPSAMPLIDTHELLPELAHMHATSATWQAIHAERDAQDEADYEAQAIACKAPRRAMPWLAKRLPRPWKR